MNREELQAVFPAVLDGSCPLGIFADACDDCNLSALLVDNIRRLCVLEFEDGFDERTTVTVFRVGVGDVPLENEWVAAVRHDVSARMLTETVRDGWLACRKLAVRWIKECLGIIDVKCKRCKGTGKEQHSGGKNCPRCGGTGIMTTAEAMAIAVLDGSHSCCMCKQDVKEIKQLRHLMLRVVEQLDSNASCLFSGSDEFVHTVRLLREVKEFLNV